MHNFLRVVCLFVLLDAGYLFTMKTHLNRQIVRVQKQPVVLRVSGVILCYILLLFCLYHFILRPSKSVMDAFLLGVCVYGVYETTNYASFINWSLSTVLMDTLWGGILFATVTYLTR